MGYALAARGDYLLRHSVLTRSVGLRDRLNDSGSGTKLPRGLGQRQRILWKTRATEPGPSM